MLEKAISIAINAHYGQEDRFGKPIILHLLRVMHKGQNETEQIAGVLHDLIEDTDWTLEGLKREGVSQEIIEAIDALTKRDEERHENYIERVSKNDLALKIKISDLEDNMNLSNAVQIQETELKRLNNYLESYKKLTMLKDRIYVNQLTN